MALCPLSERVGRHIVFGMDPVSVSVGLAFCLHSYLITVEQFLTTLAQILHWDSRKE